MMNIPEFNDEIENVYGILQRSAVRSMAITSAVAAEGVSVTAQALTNRLLMAGHSALMVDLNIYNPATEYLIAPMDVEQSATLALSAPTMMTTVGTELALLGVRAEPSKALLNMLRQPQFLENQIKQWQTEFDYIVIDAPPLLGPESHAVPAEHVAAACDASLLVVLTCQTSDRLVSEAIRKLKSEDATILGCIMNDHYNPLLQMELIREVERLPRIFAPVKRWLRQRIENNRYLSMEV